jgi:hypothetical protein
MAASRFSNSVCSCAKTFARSIDFCMRIERFDAKTNQRMLSPQSEKLPLENGWELLEGVFVGSAAERSMRVLDAGPCKIWLDRPMEQRVFRHFGRVRVGLQRIERFQDALEQAVGLRDGSLQNFDGVSLRGEAVIQRCHCSGKKLLHGCYNLRGRREFRQFPGMLLETSFDLTETGSIGRILGSQTGIQIGN